MTHKEIAKIANVSLSTVSKALSGSKEISSEVSAQIRKIAIETGYFKEKSIRRLEYMKEKNATIAILTPELLGVQYSRILTSIKNEVEKRGGNVAVYVYDFSEEKKNQIISVLAVKNYADGLIVISSNKLITEPKIPVRLFNDRDDEGDTTEAIMNIIVDYLKESGHKKIAYMGEKYTMKKLHYFKKTMEKYGLSVNNNYIYVSNKRFEEIGYECAEELLKQKVFPTAVVAAYDEIAISAMFVLEKNGILVPNDISIIGINNIPYSEYCSTPLTTVESFSLEQCEAVVEALFEDIFHGISTTGYIKMKPRIVIRESVSQI